MTLTALLVATSVQAAQQTEKSLYERLGGVFAIAEVVDHFSDAIVQNPIVGKNSKKPALRKWHTTNLGRLLFFWWACEESFALWGSIGFEQLLVDPLKQFVRARFCAQLGPIRQENQFTVDQFPVVVLARCNHVAFIVCHLWSLPV